MSPCFIINARNERVVLIVAGTKRRTSTQNSARIRAFIPAARVRPHLTADDRGQRVNISKSNLYHYFKNKEELFYELTDSAADGLKRMILRFRSMRFDLNMDAQEFRMLLSKVLSLLLCLAEKYGLLLIMEQANGTRYENLRPVMIELIASQIVPMLADERAQPDDGADHGTQSGGWDGAYPQEPRSPERGPCRTESVDHLSHTGNARAAMAALRLSRNYSFADNWERTVGRSKVVRKFLYRNFLPPEVQKG